MFTKQEGYLHVQRLLSFGGLLLGAVAHHSVAMRQVQVECNQWPVLHAQSAQGGSIDLQERRSRGVAGKGGRERGGSEDQH